MRKLVRDGRSSALVGSGASLVKAVQEVRRQRISVR
jgi:hypothetical protein